MSFASLVVAAVVAAVCACPLSRCVLVEGWGGHSVLGGDILHRATSQYSGNGLVSTLGGLRRACAAC